MWVSFSMISRSLRCIYHGLVQIQVPSDFQNNTINDGTVTCPLSSFLFHDISNTISPLLKYDLKVFTVIKDCTCPKLFQKEWKDRSKTKIMPKEANANVSSAQGSPSVFGRTSGRGMDTSANPSLACLPSYQIRKGPSGRWGRTPGRRPRQRHCLISEWLISSGYRSYWLISDRPRARTRGYGAARILLFGQSIFDFENERIRKTLTSCNSGNGCGKAEFRWRFGSLNGSFSASGWWRDPLDNAWPPTPQGTVRCAGRLWRTVNTFSFYAPFPR